MRALAYLITSVIVNVFALLVAANYISGFVLVSGLQEVLMLALIFTLLNVFLKPVLTLFLGPVITLTLGIALILVHALLLVILDTFSKNLTIESIPALFFATLLIGVINWIAHMGFKKRE